MMWRNAAIGSAARQFGIRVDKVIGGIVDVVVVVGGAVGNGGYGGCWRWRWQLQVIGECCCCGGCKAAAAAATATAAAR